MSARIQDPKVTNAVRGRWLVFCAALLWSLAGVFIKHLDLPPLTIVFYRSLFASLVFFPFLKRQNLLLNPRVILSALAFTAAISAFVAANKLTTAANAIVLQYTAPIFVFLAALVSGERIARLNIVALVVSMAGISVIAIDNLGQPEMAGVALAIFSGALLAAYMVNLASLAGTDAVYLTWLNNLACAAMLLCITYGELSLSLKQLLLLAVMGSVQLGLPYFLFMKGVQSISVQEASLIALIEPVVNPLWVALIVGEMPSRSTIAGGGLIVCGLALRYIWPLVSNSAQPSAPNSI